MQTFCTLHYINKLVNKFKKYSCKTIFLFLEIEKRGWSMHPLLCPKVICISEFYHSKKLAFFKVGNNVLELLGYGYLFWLFSLNCYFVYSQRDYSNNLLSKFWKNLINNGTLIPYKGINKCRIGHCNWNFKRPPTFHM